MEHWRTIDRNDRDKLTLDMKVAELGNILNRKVGPLNKTKLKGTKRRKERCLVGELLKRMAEQDSK